MIVLLTLIVMSYESKKNAYLWRHLGASFIRLNDVNFYLQKRLEIFDRNSADKIQSEKDKRVKVPFLMPIGVNIKVDISNVFMLFVNFLVQTQCTENLIFILFCAWKHEKNPNK